MLFTTTPQFVVLALVLVAGWLLGLASHPGGRRWKERYAAEREAHATARRDADARIAEADRRAAEAERARSAAPVVTERPVAADRITPARPIAANAARPAYASGERRGWFDWNPATPR